MRLIRIAVYLLLGIIGVSFAALNAGNVPINLYVTTLTLPISVVVIVTLAIGLIMGLFLFLFRYLHLKVEFIKTKNQLKITEKEIKNLRDIPLKDQH